MDELPRITAEIGQVAGAGDLEQQKVAVVAVKERLAALRKNLLKPAGQHFWFSRRDLLDVFPAKRAAITQPGTKDRVSKKPLRYSLRELATDAVSFFLAAGSGASRTGGEIRASEASKTYRWPGCPGYDRPGDKTFLDPWAAQRAGFAPAHPLTFGIRVLALLAFLWSFGLLGLGTATQKVEFDFTTPNFQLFLWVLGVAAFTALALRLVFYKRPLEGELLHPGWQPIRRSVLMYVDEHAQKEPTFSFKWRGIGRLVTISMGSFAVPLAATLADTVEASSNALLVLVSVLALVGGYFVTTTFSGTLRALVGGFRWRYRWAKLQSRLYHYGLGLFHHETAQELVRKAGSPHLPWLETLGADDAAKASKTLQLAAAFAVSPHVLIQPIAAKLKKEIARVKKARKPLIDAKELTRDESFDGKPKQQ